MSPQFLHPKGNSYWNIYSSTYMVGKLDYERCKYNIEKTEEIDYYLISMLLKH